jgi:hypothetical protein
VRGRAAGGALRVREQGLGEAHQLLGTVLAHTADTPDLLFMKVRGGGMLGILSF